jgi:protein phosphatase PTC6
VDSLGDLQFKKFGVTPEPDVRTKLLNGENGKGEMDIHLITRFISGSEWAYIALVSDGISSILSDQEVVDLARDAVDPKAAADNILAFAQELGSDDNATAIVVPLAGWGKIQGPDKTKDLRDFRQRQSSESKSFIKRLLRACFCAHLNLMQSEASVKGGCDECQDRSIILM